MRHPGGFAAPPDAATPADMGLGTPEMRLPYDRHFHPAVAQGLLSVQQAIARGSRQAWAERLIQRHELSLEAALEVTDNRLTLQQALAGPRRPASEISVKPVERRRSWPVLLLAAVGGLALGVTLALNAGRSHILRAESLVSEFERGRPAAAVDYANPVYERALSELRFVPEFSLWAPRAESLRREIRSGIDDQRRRQELERAEREQAEQLRRERREAFTLAATREWSVPTQQHGDPECE